MIPGLSLPLRDYVYLAIILIVALGLAYCHHAAVLKGAAMVRAADDRAVVLAQRAVDAQKLADAKTAQEATDGLKNELATLRRNAAEHKPVRLCVSPARRPVPATPQPAGGTASAAPAAGELPSVSSGAGAGPDLGPELQRVAEAADVLAARDRACLAWARAIAK